MIEIKDKKDCCGCSSCVQKCPVHCISLHEDEEGFLYPITDVSKCIDCGLCEIVCPTLQSTTSKIPIQIYASKNKNERIRKVSSSGGLFSVLSEYIINQGGVVFGARFDIDWELKHDYTETIEGLAAFRGSKYIQSRIGKSYQIVEHFLKEGKKVLFSGTPCQIAGLNSYLRKDYSNLFTVEIICHGVPSPKVWRLYLNELYSKLTNNSYHNEVIKNICFRNKEWGWKKYCFSLEINHSETSSKSIHEPFHENTYMRGFISNLYLRPSCYNCLFKSGKSKSDISIADYWSIQKIHPTFDDDKGTNIVLINTNKGLNIYNAIASQIDSISSDYKIAQEQNGGFNEHIIQHPNRSSFFKEIDKEQSIIKTIKKNIKPSLISRIMTHFKRMF